MRYISGACTMGQSARLGEAMDRAPRPYTVEELADITGVPPYAVRGWVRANYIAQKISRRPIMRDTRAGRPLHEYWRGTQSIINTFEGANDMDEQTRRRLEDGTRPVTWRDDTRTTWSVDEADMVSAMKGSAVVRFGKMASVRTTQTGMTIRIKDGPELRFKR